ncbi:DUF3592 domain-containing protein [Ktedonospora formicarum]|uniref:DUF3592 domain-containing protein n=1 Tax=Ktedonospora formicarum TaxID=2778364 RepID=A0A8J3HZ11_9CHLR|nr:DUF3592 domain-containing protein [Ktedonospora formicarum]GHO44596.1 hypothetical protein KSX_27590 [Ktedonospora formicarum]
MKKRAFFLRRIILIICVAIILALIAPVRRALYYHSFIQGTCVITARHLQSDSQNSKRPIYKPIFTYTLTLPDGRQINTSGFDGPDTFVYSTQKLAQNVLDSYPLGQPINCWYDPAQPERALLVFQGYSSEQALSTFLFFLLAFMIFLPALAYLFEWQFWRYVALRIRGTLTRGIVVNRIEQRKQGMTYNVYTILYRSEDQQGGVARHIQLTAPPIERHSLPDLYNVFVCYDPRQPLYDRCGKYPRLYRIIPGLIGSLIFLALTLSFIYMALFNLYWN